jgi:hypothetical protein
VRFQERQEYAPVRLQDRDHDGAGVTEESRLRRQGTAHKTRHQSLRRQDSLHHQPVSTVCLLDLG